MFTAKVREKSNGKMKQMRLLAVLLAPAVALIIGAIAPKAWAQSVIQLDDALIRFEANLTDEDLGIQIFLDGVGWEEMTVFYPNGDSLMTVTARDMQNPPGPELGVVSNEGITELFLESAEPEFFGNIAEFLIIQARFPEGRYTFAGSTVDGETLRGSAILSHLVPGEPEISFPEEDAIVNLNDPVTIEWESVTESFPDADPVRIDKYQVIVQNEKRGTEFTAIVPAGVTEVSVPSQILQRNQVYKVEVLAIEINGNQSISELTFRTR